MSVPADRKTMRTLRFSEPCFSLEQLRRAGRDRHVATPSATVNIIGDRGMNDERRGKTPLTRRPEREKQPSQPARGDGSL
jgi:hypothetical protein